MLQQSLGGHVLRQREPPGSARDADEEGHPVEVEVIQRRIRTGSRIERSRTQELLDFQILHQRSIQRGLQLLQGVEPLPDQSGLRLADQRPHPGVPRAILGPLHENQAMHAERGRTVELPFRRRDPFSIFAPIPPTEQPDIEVAPLYFVQVELVGPLIRRGRVFEQEHVEEAPQERILAHVVAQRLALLSELALHAADEDAKGFHGATCSSSEQLLAVPNRSLQVGR